MSYVHDITVRIRLRIDPDDPNTDRTTDDLSHEAIERLLAKLPDKLGTWVRVEDARATTGYVNRDGVPTQPRTEDLR